MSNRPLVYFGAGALLVLASFFSFDVAIIPMTALPALPVLLIVFAVLCALSLRKDDTTSRRRAWTVGRVTGLVLAVYVGCAFGYRSMVFAVQEQAQPMIDALESHHARTSTYPAAVTELVPSPLPELPWRFEGGLRSALGGRFRYDTSGASYRLTIDTFFWQRLSYSPEDGWYTWD